MRGVIAGSGGSWASNILIDLLQLASAAGLLASITIIVVLSIWEFWRDMKAKKSGLKITDERTRRVQGQAALYSWVVGLEFTAGLILVLLFGSQYPWFPAVSAMLALSASLLVSAASFFVLRWYLSRKEYSQ